MVVRTEAQASRRSSLRRRPWSLATVGLLRKNRDLLVGTLLTGFLIIILAAPGVWTPYGPNEIDTTRSLQALSAEHVFGTDELGRDVATRVLWGTRITLGMVALALGIPAVLGAILGLLAGYYRGAIDVALSRGVDVLLSFPSMITAVIITGILGPGIRNGVLALALIYLPMFYRVARGATMAEANKTYVEAARALGVRSGSTVFRHVARNIVTPIMIQFTILVPAAIQIAAALGYLGLGVQPPTPEWGAILNQGKNYMFNAPWISVFPGIAIVFSAVAISTLGRGLQKAFDPSAKT
ncbi:MAG TPA: ABC transporter permease [Trueperaceae bacterium]|nr:ABC transporter permease [Trueperaceae bacterium]